MAPRQGNLKSKPLPVIQFRGSIVVSISACHAEDPGSIPGRGVFRFWRAATPALDAHTCLRAARWRRVRPGFFAVPVWQWRGSLGSTCLLSNSVLDGFPSSNGILLFAPLTEGAISRGMLTVSTFARATPQ